MQKMIRWAALAVVLLAGTAAVLPVAQAQGQPATPAPAADAASTAAPAPAQAAKAAPAARATEVVDNPYGLEALWRGSDVVAKSTLIILIIMSMGTWYIIVTKVYEQHKVNQAARKAERKTEKAYRRALARLFDVEAEIHAMEEMDRHTGPLALKSVIEVLQKREIYRHLSNASDRVAGAGEALRDIVVKLV